ncbi:hypothetical protein B0H17DRAFT_941971 [Mycena rosella]|uniref:Helitron helicase-like domain-containing protein n=1 Tax=Mycena rosella TaxID=1033263 RepID=A0AAD7D7Y4_MYCRO|nr:hypothetical protein B0H17DRAFT_941971 [Mycena rosella]
MVNTFITDVLGWQSEERGLFGHPNAFYGTVEQQGHLTLHLHLLLWVANAMSPQEIRDKVMGPTSHFRRRLIRYLESCHQAELFNGTMASAIERKEKVKAPQSDLGSDSKPTVIHSEYQSPTHTFAAGPPPMCTDVECKKTCTACVRLARWTSRYKKEVNDLLVRSNVHDHHHSRNGSRFPRDVFTVSGVDENGHVNMRHMEPMMNTVNPLLTYVSRCNTDVTSLLSGTAVKAVVSYVSDYISKLSLKLYQMFASVYHVFDKEADTIGGDIKEREQARHMMRKMVNSMSAKIEIGSPMASMYVLGHPDHYPSHTYEIFPWRSYIMFVCMFWTQQAEAIVKFEDDDDEAEERVPIGRQDGKFVAASGVDDYRFRPVVYSHVSLYEWIQCADRRARTKQE